MGWKKILKKLLFKIAMVLLNAGLNWAFKAADKDGDGYLTRDEIWNFIVDKLSIKYLK